MKDGLVNAVIGTGIAVLATSAIRCASVDRQFPQGMISGIEYQTLDQSRVPYKLEPHIIYDEKQYFFKREKTPITLPIESLDSKDVTKELDLDSKIVTLISDKRYIPVKVRSKKKGKLWATEIFLRGDGPYGIRANMLKNEQLRRMADNPNKFGYKVITTENGASFMFRTIKILDEEYFFPLVENKEMNKKGKKNYYLMSTRGAKIMEKEECGNLSLSNENGFYRSIDPDEYPKLFKEPKEGIQARKVK